MAYMNTTVTRGRAELVVTATGMHTEIGRIAGLLRTTETETTPLQTQLDGLAHSLAKLAGVIVAAVFVIGLIRGEAVERPAAHRRRPRRRRHPRGPARRHRGHAGPRRVEDGQAARDRQAPRLGRDARLHERDLQRQDRHADPQRDDRRRARRPAPPARGDRRRLRARSATIEHARRRRPRRHRHGAAADGAVQRRRDPRRVDGEWELVGDPTEGALVVLAAKGGIDVADLRAATPASPRCRSTRRTSSWPRCTRCVTDRGERVVRLLREGRARRAARPVHARHRRRRRAAPPSPITPRRSPTTTSGSAARACACSPSPSASSSLEAWAEFADERRRPDRPGRRPHPAGARRHRRPAPPRGTRRHRRGARAPAST